MLFFFLLSLYSAEASSPALSSSAQVDRTVFSTIEKKARERQTYYADSETVFAKLNLSKSPGVEIFRRDLPGRIRLFSAIYQNLIMLCQQGKEGQCDFQKCLVMVAYALLQGLDEQNGLTGEDLNLSKLSDTDERDYLKGMKRLISREIKEAKMLEFVQRTVESRDGPNGHEIVSKAYRQFVEQDKALRRKCQTIVSHCQSLASSKNSQVPLGEQADIFIRRISRLPYFLTSKIIKS